MLIDVLRHGETERSHSFCGSTDVALSTQGWEQMRGAVANASWDVIVSSPLRRCAEFARELAARSNATLTFDERWRELHFGAWEGKSTHEIPADALARFWSNPWFSPPHGGEALPCFEARVLDAWHALHQHGAGRRVLVVAHAGVIRMLLCRARGLSHTELLNIDVPHASLHRISSALPW